MHQHEEKQAMRKDYGPLTVESLVRFAKDYRNVSTGDIRRKFAEASGNGCIHLPDPNVEILHGLSPLAMEVVDEALRSQLLHLHPSSVLVYLCDGAPFPRDMPMATKKPPKVGYKKPRWVPVVLYPGASCGSKDCPGKFGWGAKR